MPDHAIELLTRSSEEKDSSDRQRTTEQPVFINISYARTEPKKKYSEESTLRSSVLYEKLFS